MAKSSKKPVTMNYNLTFERETPGTFLFKEDGKPDTHISGSLYIRKGALPKGRTFESAEVTVVLR